MGLTDKKKNSFKESLLKLKSHRIRFGNVKDFHGHRQYTSENHKKNVRGDFITEETKKLVDNSTIIPLMGFTQHSFSSSKHLSELTLTTDCTKASAFTSLTKLKPVVNYESSKPTYSFDEHMTQWAEGFCKPLTIPSANSEFEMPYCYSEEFYSKVSAKCYMMQPFGSIGEPLMTWNSHVDVWYEKAQLALQYYRQLCVQPSRIPTQITIKRSVVQFIAEQCALLGTDVYFETFDNDGSGIKANLVIQEKSKSTIYLVPVHENPLKQSKGTELQLKSDSSIYTSSWQS